MFTRGWAWISIVALLAMGSPTAGAADEPRPVVITTQEWSPYNYTLPDGTVGGVATDVIRRALDRMKVKYTISVYPWLRAQSMVKEGSADAFFVASRNPDRDEFAVMSDVIAEQKSYWYLHKDSTLNPNDPSFASKATVGALAGSNMMTYLRKGKYKITGSPASMDNLVMMLDIKRFDAMLVNDQVARIYFEKNRIDASKYRKILCQDLPLGIYFSKRFLKEHPSFLDQFNSALK